MEEVSRRAVPQPLVRPSCLVSMSAEAPPSVALALNMLDLPWTASSDGPDAVVAVRQANLILAVIDYVPNPATLVEIGVALSLEKPILLLVRDRNAVPLVLAGLPQVEMTSEDPAGIAYQISSFIDAFVARVRPRRSTPARGAEKGARAADREPAMRSAPESRTPLRLSPENSAEESVAELLEAAGGKVVSQPLGPQARWRPDLAVWFPFLEGSFNPVIVEIAGRLAKTDKIYREMHQQLVAGRGRIALVVRLDDEVEPRDAEARSSWPGVFVLTLRELQAHVEQGTFEHWLRRARNVLVHAVR